jgi:protein-S-isoprenylcysteine O-methyltransferase Ste14
MAIAALIGYALFAALAFGWRSAVQLRRTGSTGFRGLSGRPGSMAWNAGALLVVGAILAFAAPVLALAGASAPIAALDRPAVHAIGGVLFAIGLVATLWAQLAMGDSWRIGVDESERTTLVARGPFRWVRNPIFTSMIVAIAGLALLTPNAVALAAVATIVVALELHVRIVEEPYLSRVHGAAYAAYRARTGRFVPGLGR